MAKKLVIGKRNACQCNQDCDDFDENKKDDNLTMKQPDLQELLLANSNKR